MSTLINQPTIPGRQVWSAVASMAMCAAMLIASEFMPVSLLTPIASDLRASVGMAGQAISISGLFAVVTSLIIPSLTSRFDRRNVLAGLAGLMLMSLILIAESGSFETLMAARALLGIAVGGFWSLATATIMRLVPEKSLPKALGVLYTGNAVATSFAAPIGSYLGSVIGWRGVFWALVPIVAINLALMLITLPSMKSEGSRHTGTALSLLGRTHVAFAMLAVMLTFGGAFAVFTYFPAVLRDIHARRRRRSVDAFAWHGSRRIRGHIWRQRDHEQTSLPSSDGVARCTGCCDDRHAREWPPLLDGSSSRDWVGRGERCDSCRMVHMAFQGNKGSAGNRRRFDGCIDSAIHHGGRRAWRHASRPLLHRRGIYWRRRSSGSLRDSDR